MDGEESKFPKSPQDVALAHPAAVLTKIGGFFPRETEAGGGESKGKTERKWGSAPLPCRGKKRKIKLGTGGGKNQEKRILWILEKLCFIWGEKCWNWAKSRGGTRM